jgi:hypothetical protein
MRTNETGDGVAPGDVFRSDRRTDPKPSCARRTLLALSLLGAVALGAPQTASAFPGFYVPGPRFYAPPIHIPAPPVYYVPGPRVRYYAPYRARRRASTPDHLGRRS